MIKTTKILASRVQGASVITDKGLQIGRLHDMLVDENSGRISMLVVSPAVKGLLENVPKDKDGNFLIPYSAIIAISDHIVVNEQVLLTPQTPKQ